ncbi:MAG: phycobilisome linker polypeptide [Kaiparowitsia implicata GSE-PSE-MK54-09C]|jgi:phycocyanin-associated rod linker protein|nr:phycobilisome linker polypeptide [Kaiparowitsia implicata GSE-PSE-MK54-09C]
MTGLVAANQLGISAYDASERVELRSTWTEDDVQAVIWAAYRQVLGHDHLMGSERLVSAESLLRQGQTSVQDFVRAIALSELYKEKFFYSTPQVRFIELNFKHLLGRAPYDESEISHHVDLYNQQGYDAEINSYLDSAEYQESFGNGVVPHYRGFQTQRGQKTVGFPRMFRLFRGYANSDRAQFGKNRSRLTQEVARNQSMPVVPPVSGVRAVSAKADGSTLVGAAAGDREQLFRVRVVQSASGGATPLRLSNRDLLVPYGQLSARLQQLNRSGGRVVSVSPA